ncbi:MAG: hypothetical protein ACI920_003818, partial [Saprospiraceae bacterium]
RYFPLKNSSVMQTMQRFLKENYRKNLIFKFYPTQIPPTKVGGLIDSRLKSPIEQDSFSNGYATLLCKAN